MKCVTFVRWAATLLLIPILNSKATVLTGPIKYGGHDYYLLEPSNWLDAEAEAQSLGGHLVTINDEAEQASVVSSFASGDSVYRSLWIGLNDRAIEGQFAWSSREPVTYTNWNRGEPNDNATSEGEDCAHIWPLTYGDGQWNGAWNDLAYWTGPFDRDGRLVTLYGVVEISGVPESGPSTCLVLLTFGALATIGRLDAGRIRRPTS